MKYYLVIGYQTIEKWREYGRIQILLNGILLDDFVADNENQIDISHKHNNNLDHVNSFTDFVLENQYIQTTSVENVLFLWGIGTCVISLRF